MWEARKTPRGKRTTREVKPSHFDLIKLVHHPHFAVLDKQHLIQVELGTQLEAPEQMLPGRCDRPSGKAALTGKLPGPLF